MKRLWQVIEREMHSEALSAREMARKLGMDPAHLSRLRTGQLRDLSPESLANLLAGLGTALQSEALAAYLADKLEGSAPNTADAAADAVRHVLMHEEPPIYRANPPETVADLCIRSGVNRRVAAAIEALADQARTNRRLQALLVSLADFAKKK